MKKKPIFCLILALCLFLGAGMIPAGATEDISVTSGCSTLDAQLPLAGDDRILASAGSVILYERNTDTLVYAYRPDDRINPSSMVKIVSALVALEYGSLDDVVTVSRGALDSIPIGSMSAGLKRGEELTLRDLLYCSIVGSANDATAVIAEHIAGSQAAFVDMMNTMAAELGCRDSYFSNVNGLNDDIQYSTARDLAVITKAALENETFALIFSTDQHEIPATNKSEPRTIYTTNFMQTEKYLSTHYDSRVTGGKTAAATQTKRSLICTAAVGSAEYLCVVMDADSVMSEDKLSVEVFGNFQETEALLDYAQSSFAVRQILQNGLVYSQHSVSGGENDVAIAPSADMFAVLPLEYEAGDLSFTLEADTSNFAAPIAKDGILASLLVRYRGIILGRCDMKALHSVAEKGSTITPATLIGGADLSEKTTQLWFVVMIAAGGVLLLVILGILAVRMIRNARIRRLYRKRKRNRRRSR